MKGVPIALAGVIALLLALAGPADAACGGVKHVRPKTDRNPGRAPLAIGDSVLLGALGEVSGAGFEIDTRGCRSMREGLNVMRRRGRRLPRFVVIMLGANSDVTAREIRAAVRIAGRRRVVGLVPPTNGGPDRARMLAAQRRYRGRVLTLDWVGFSRGHGGWFADDGLHLGRGGASGLARLLGRGLRRLYPLVGRFSGGRGPGGSAGW